MLHVHSCTAVHAEGDQTPCNIGNTVTQHYASVPHGTKDAPSDSENAPQQLTRCIIHEKTTIRGCTTHVFIHASKQASQPHDPCSRAEQSIQVSSRSHPCSNVPMQPTFNNTTCTNACQCKRTCTNQNHRVSCLRQLLSLIHCTALHRSEPASLGPCLRP